MIDSANARTTRRRRGGMSLVEIMVAMVVLSFGLLGVAALQVRAITEKYYGRLARTYVFPNLEGKHEDQGLVSEMMQEWREPTEDEAAVFYEHHYDHGGAI